MVQAELAPSSGASDRTASIRLDERTHLLAPFAPGLKTGAGRGQDKGNLGEGRKETAEVPRRDRGSKDRVGTRKAQGRAPSGQVVAAGCGSSRGFGKPGSKGGEGTKENRGGGSRGGAGARKLREGTVRREVTREAGRGRARLTFPPGAPPPGLGVIGACRAGGSRQVREEKGPCFAFQGSPEALGF